MRKLFIALVICTTYSMAGDKVAGYPLEESSQINGVILKTGKRDKTRVYSGSITKEINADIANVRRAIREFENRCSNELKDKRVQRAESFNCTMHNSNIVESIKITKLEYNKPEPFKLDQYIMSRVIYNRGTYTHYDLITEREMTQSNGQKVITIQQKMLSDKEAEIYLGKKYRKRETVFLSSQGIFTLKSIGPNKTLLTYDYVAETDHWILNKSIAISRYFNGTSKSLNGLYNVIAKKSMDYKSKSIASTMGETIPAQPQPPEANSRHP